MRFCAAHEGTGPTGASEAGLNPSGRFAVKQAARQVRMGFQQVTQWTFRRVIRPSDADTIREIVASTGFFTPAEISLAVELFAERQHRGEGSGYEFVFAEQQGQTRSYACYGLAACSLSSYDLYWIATHHGSQGLGLGTAVLREVERLIRQAGGERIYIETSGRPLYLPTQRFYERSGYACEAVLAEFYGPSDDKRIYVKVLANECSQ